MWHIKGLYHFSVTKLTNIPNKCFLFKSTGFLCNEFFSKRKNLQNNSADLYERPRRREAKLI